MNRRDDQRPRDRYRGYLLHELICAGGSKWLDGRNRKALRLTHESQRLLMPEEAKGLSDENEEEHNAWNRGLGLFTLQGSSPKIQQCLRGGGMQDRTYTPLRAGRY